MSPSAGRLARPRRRRPAPRLEPLEGRSIPAGVVNATFAAGVLTLTAVDDPTDVNITGTNSQNITLDGAGVNNITVTANTSETGTAITGSPFSGVTSIKLVMGLGSDTVTMTDAVLAGGVTFLGGSGNNSLNIDGAGNYSGLAGASPGNVTIASLTVTNGSGSDTVFIGGGTNRVNGNVTIADGVGGSDIQFGVLTADVTAVGGALKITNLDGFDLVTTNGATVTFTGPVTVGNGNGGSLLDFAATTNSLDGGITVTNGDGNDDFNTGGTTFTVGTPAAPKNLTITNGTGAASNDQNFSATTNTINGNLSVTGGAGDDDFTVDGNTFTVLVGVKVSTGNGGGVTDISPNLDLNVAGAVTVTAAEGADTLAISGNGSVDLGSVRFSSGNGASTLDIGGGDAHVTGGVTHTHLAGTSSTTFGGLRDTIDGAITVTNGDGADTFDLAAIDFTAGAITIRNGNGPGTTRINATGSNTILGNVSVTNGDGTDTFRTGGSSFTLGTATARRNLTIRNGNGDSDTKLNATTNTVNGSIAVTNGGGFDTFTVGGTAFTVTGAGNVTIANGVGGGDTEIDAGTSGTIGGKLTVTAADGDDFVSLGRLTVTGATSFNLGNGLNTVRVNNSTFNGSFALTGGAGADSVVIENGVINDGVSTVFNAAVNINMGGGDDQVSVGVIGDANDFGDFNAAVTIAGGLDLDIVQALSNAANTFAVAPVETGFEQGT